MSLVDISRKDLIQFLKSKHVEDGNFGLAADEFFERFQTQIDEQSRTLASDRSFRDNVNFLLAETGMSQADLAQRIGTSQANVSMLMKKNRPTTSSVKKIADALGVQPNQLI